MNIEGLNEKIDGLKNLLEAHQIRQDEQFAQLERYLILKIDSDKCESCSMTPRVEKLETKTDILNDWRAYTVAIASCIAVLIPYLLSELF